jgi:hypothetical protein
MCAILKSILSLTLSQQQYADDIQLIFFLQLLSLSVLAIFKPAFHLFKVGFFTTA